MPDPMTELNNIENFEPSKSRASETTWYKVRVVEANAEATMLLQNALVLIDEGENEIAREVLRSISGAAEKNPNVLFWLIQTELRTGQYEVALQLSEQLYDTVQDFVSANMLADCLYRTGQDERARDYYFRALNYGDRDEEILFDCYKNLGNIFVKTSDFKSAEEFYFKAMSINEGSDALQVNLGTLAIQQSDLETAAKYFRHAIELNPKNDRAWVGLGLVHKQYADHELAWGNVIHALDLNPLNQTAVQMILSWAETNEQWAIVEECLIQAIEQDGLNVEMSLTLSKVFIRNKRFDLAQIELARAEALGACFDEVIQLRKLILRERQSGV